MKKAFIIALVMVSTIANAQSFKETFDANSLGWTESVGESSSGTAIIDKGVLTIESKGENKFFATGENTFFETHAYAPLDVQKPFEMIANVKIDKLGYDRICGLIFNYRDGGTFYAFIFNEEEIMFSRYVDNRLVGQIHQAMKWKDKTKINQQWKLVSDGDLLSFFVDDMEILKVKYMPLEYTGVGFYTFGKQKLIVDDIEFFQR